MQSYSALILRHKSACKMGVYMIKGKQSIEFECPPYVLAHACIAGQKEGEGPLGQDIDEISKDPMFGKKTWEEAESMLQKLTAEKLLTKASMKNDEIRYIFAGDLLGQLIATSYGIMDLQIPLFGVYGACSTMGETMSLASMTVAGGYARNVIALASSHFASAEKQFRFPLEYGNQRPLAATWTVTGCGAVVIGDGKNEQKKSHVRIAGVTTGKIVDYGVKDSMNMGACMAPAAAELIMQNYSDFGVKDGFYDLVITGDLGYVGKTIVLDLLEEKGIKLEDIYSDCGIEIFDKQAQDTHSGGSGCGCSAVTLCAKLLPQLESGALKRVLFVPTGALLSPTSFNEGKSVPGIAHGIILEHC